jgi:hypothetical protein
MTLFVVEPRACRKRAEMPGVNIAGCLRLLQDDKVASVETLTGRRSVIFQLRS